MKKIIIRCLTVPKKGYGNFNRCLNFAEYLRKKKYKLFFIVDSNKSVFNELEKRKFDYFSIPTKKTYSQKNSIFIKFLQNNYFDFCVLDMREYGENLSKNLFKKKITHILFDDAWCKYVYADMIFNGTNVKKYHCYKTKNKNSILCLGLNFWIIDKKFKEYRKKLTSIKPKKIFSIVISMGGSDQYNLTITTLNALLQIPNLHLSVIVGKFFTQKNLLKKLIQSNSRISFYDSPDNIWKIFSEADLAICNGGNTLFELTCMGIPTICIPTVKHEIKYVKEFNSRKCVLELKLRERNASKITSSVVQMLANTDLRKMMSSNCQKNIDGKGLDRVFKKICELS